jgi:Uma2 family endonuclease
MVSTKVKFTYNDYRTTPEDERYELLEGELVMVPAPNFAHQNISAHLGATLWRFVREHNIGVVLSAPLCRMSRLFGYLLLIYLSWQTLLSFVSFITPFSTERQLPDP